METRTLFIDLDSLLDTRLATLARLNPLAASELVKRDSDYRQRDMDDWDRLTDGAVSNEAFREAYAKRDKETLKLARPTNAVKLIHQISRALAEQAIFEPDVDRTKIAINTYPYDLSPQEEEMIVGAVMVYCSIAAEVVAVNYSLEELTPAKVKEEWDGVVLYDFDHWLSLHTNELNTVRMPTHTFVSPALFVKPVGDYSELIIPGLESHTPFEVMELAMVERMDLAMVCPSYFSIL